jgi:hypothetical protein
MPFWLRIVSLIGVILLCTGAGLLGYRWYNRPVTLTLAVGSIDGEAARAMSAIASQLASDGASVRLKVIDTGTAIESGKQFAAGNVDLAAVRRPGRGSTYRRGIFVQTTGTSSDRRRTTFTFQVETESCLRTWASRFTSA